MPADAPPIRVLIVDDHVLVAEGLEALLAAEPDLEVVAIAGTVTDATRAARQHRPDVVVMDHRLPDGDGATATREIRSDRPETQVVMVTGSAHDTVLAAALEAGCSGFLTKDQPAADVADAVRAAHVGEATIPADMLARLLPRLQPQSRRVGAITPREQEVLELLAAGLSNQAIAERLVLSVSTVRNHVQAIIGKLGAHSKLEAVSIAVRQGLVTYPG